MSLPRMLRWFAVIGILVLLVAAWLALPPGPQGDASGPACRLLSISSVNQALGASQVASRDERPIDDDGVTVNVCAYVDGELFGRGGGDFAWLYVGDYPSPVSAEREIRSLSASRQLSSSDYVVEPSSGVGDAAAFCVTPPQFSPRQNLGLAAVRQSAQTTRMVSVFVSAKLQPSKETLISLVRAVLDSR